MLTDPRALRLYACIWLTVVLGMTVAGSISQWDRSRRTQHLVEAAALLNQAAITDLQTFGRTLQQVRDSLRLISRQLQSCETP